MSKKWLTKEELKSAVEKAIPNNLKEDGSINWDYVDSDIWLDGIGGEVETVPLYNKWFNEIADEIESR